MTPHARAARLVEMIGASWMSRVIAVAAELRIAERLSDGSRRIEELADGADCEPHSLQRLMRALVSLDLCVERKDGTFSLTSTGALLREHDDWSLRSWAIWWGSYQWSTWASLGRSVRTGESARTHATGLKGYAHLDADPGAAATFDQAMRELTRLAAKELVRVYDFSGVACLVDIGGGCGELVALLLPAYPAMRAVLLDLPRTAEGARARLAQARLTDRCEVMNGSFFDSVPAGGDAYVLKSILHNWDDREAGLILASCRRAMTARAKLVLIERLIPARMRATPADRAVARTDLNMLVGFGGRERSRSELTDLLTDCGFTAIRYIATNLDFFVIEARPSP